MQSHAWKIIFHTIKKNLSLSHRHPIEPRGLCSQMQPNMRNHNDIR